MGRFCTLTILALMVSARLPTAQSVTGHPMHPKVEADRIAFPSGEYIPRFATYLPNSLTVRRGQTHVLAADSTYDAIEVAGVLRNNPTVDTVLRVTHLIVLPGGRLEWTLSCGRTLTVIGRNVPIDTVKDPFQWGNGLLNLGSQTRIGCAKTAWSIATDDLQAGATTLTVEDATGWVAGDELLLPDLKPIAVQPGYQGEYRREGALRIAAISGNTITLDNPLDFEHLSIREPDGRLVLRPRVANLTRGSIVIRSEDPAGVRWHTANVGHAATWDIRYNELSGMGRTKNVRVENTAIGDGVVTTIGANQAGRYGGGHDHHAQGYRSQSIGNVYRGPGYGAETQTATKWAYAVHGTHDALIEGNVAVDWPGGCFVTEDGNEVRNIFHKNFCAYTSGNAAQVNAELNLLQNPARGTPCPGCEGSQYWMHGLANTWDQNEAWNGFTGFNFLPTFPVALSYPSTPGGDYDAQLQRATQKPVRVAGNVSAVHRFAGVELWATVPFPNEDLTCAHASMHCVAALQAGTNLHLVNPMLVGHVLSHPTALARGGGDCIHANKVYTSTTRIEGGRIVGCQRGVGDGGAQLATATGTFFQNVVNWHGGNGLIADQGLRLENLTHAPLGTFPKRYIEFGFADLFWQPGQPTAFWLTSSVRPDYLVINHNGDGKTYRLFERQQLTDAPLWPAEAGQPWASPEPGLTMGQSYAKYGIAWRDTVLDPAQAVPLEGLTVGFAAPVASLPPSPARCPVTFPSREGPAIVQNGRVLIYALLTGDPSGASTRCRFQVDDLPPIVVDAGSFPADRRFVTTAVSPGTHVVKSWRLDSRNRPIPASTLTQCYYVDRPSGVCPEGGPPLPSTSARPATPSTPRGSRRP